MPEPLDLKARLRNLAARAKLYGRSSTRLASDLRALASELDDREAATTNLASPAVSLGPSLVRSSGDRVWEKLPDGSLRSLTKAARLARLEARVEALENAQGVEPVTGTPTALPSFRVRPGGSSKARAESVTSRLGRPVSLEPPEPNKSHRHSRGAASPVPRRAGADSMPFRNVKPAPDALDRARKAVEDGITAEKAIRLIEDLAEEVEQLRDQRERAKGVIADRALVVAPPARVAPLVEVDRHYELKHGLSCEGRFFLVFAAGDRRASIGYVERDQVELLERALGQTPA